MDDRHRFDDQIKALLSTMTVEERLRFMIRYARAVHQMREAYWDGKRTRYRFKPKERTLSNAVRWYGGRKKARTPDRETS